MTIDSPAMSAPQATTAASVLNDPNDPIGPGRFIVGMPRAATTWLAKCLNMHPDVAAFGESLFWGRNYLAPQTDDRYSPAQVAAIRKRLNAGDCLEAVEGEGPGCLSRVTRQTFPSLLDAAFSDLPAEPTPREVFGALASAISRGEGKPIVVEKTPHHLMWLDRIVEHYPEARFVVMLREPYGFMLSYKHQGDRKSEPNRTKFRRLYHPITCALVWKRCMEAALAAQQRYPERLHFVHFEDVKCDPAGVLYAVQQLFELEPADLASRVPADNTSFPKVQRPELQPEDVFWMNLVAGRTLDRAGYTRRQAPFAPLRLSWSLIRLPVWATWNLARFSAIVHGSMIGYLWRWIRPAGRQ